MWTKLFSEKVADSIAIVRDKGTALKATVREQATRAFNEVLGVSHEPLQATVLQRQLERDASAHHTLATLTEMYSMWIQRIHESNEGGPTFIDTISVSPTNTRNLSEDSRPPSTSGSQPCAISEGLNMPSLTVSNQEAFTDAVESIPSDEVKDIINKKYDSRDDTTGTENESSNISAFHSPSSDNASKETMLSVGADTIINLSFKQCLLRSRAVELSLISLSQITSTRQSLAGPLDEEETDTPRAIVHQLIQLCVRGDTKLRLEIVIMFCTTEGSSTDPHLQHLADVVSALKYDWKDDFLFEARRRLAGQIEQLKYGIAEDVSSHDDESIDDVVSEKQNLEVPDRLGVLLVADKHDKRVMLSRDLIRLYQETYDNLKNSALSRSNCRVRTAEKIKKLFQQLDNAEKQCIALEQDTGKRTLELQEELVKAGEISVGKLSDIQKTRKRIEIEIQKLEDERQTYICKVDALSLQITALEDERAKAIRTGRDMEKELQNIRVTYKSKLTTEDTLKGKAESRLQDLRNLKTVVHQAESQLDSILLTLSEDAMIKCERIVAPANNLLPKHLTYERARLLQYAQVLKVLIRDARNTHTEYHDECRNVVKEAETDLLARNANHDITPQSRHARVRFLRRRLQEARHELSRAIAQVAAIWNDVETFSTKHSIKASATESEDQRKEESSSYPFGGSLMTRTDDTSTTALETSVKLLREIEDLYQRITVEILSPNIDSIFASDESFDDHPLARGVAKDESDHQSTQVDQNSELPTKETKPEPQTLNAE